MNSRVVVAAHTEGTLGKHLAVLDVGSGTLLFEDVEQHYVLSLAAAEDTSKVPTVICAEAITTTDAKAVGIVRLTGEVLGSQLDIGTGHTLESVKAALRPLSIFVR